MFNSKSDSSIFLVILDSFLVFQFYYYYFGLLFFHHITVNDSFELEYACTNQYTIVHILVHFMLCSFGRINFFVRIGGRVFRKPSNESASKLPSLSKVPLNLIFFDSNTSFKMCESTEQKYQ